MLFGAFDETFLEDLGDGVVLFLGDALIHPPLLEVEDEVSLPGRESFEVLDEPLDHLLFAVVHGADCSGSQ